METNEHQEESIEEELQSTVEDFEAALLRIDRKRAATILSESFLKYPDLHRLENIVGLALERMGQDWENGSASLAQIYMGGVICEQTIEPYLKDIPNVKEDSPIIGIGVLLDQHALGKKIVSSVLRSQGYNIIDLGQGLSAQDMVRKSQEHNLDVLLISTLMLSSAQKVLQIRNMVDDSRLSMKIVVGGAPFRLNKNLWQKVGADAKGDNASEAIRAVERVLSR